MTNSIIKNYYSVFEMYQALRQQLMDSLTDEELDFRVSGQNPSLGALCREIGEIEVAYIQSFKTFRQDFTYRNETPGLEHSVDQLKRWFAELDQELKQTVESLTEEDIQNRPIDRGGGFTLLPQIQLEVYKEALLIFYGKVSVYLKAMDKVPHQQWLDWIG
jgi:uncharacterized damage-inducible protein DinB